MKTFLPRLSVGMENTSQSKLPTGFRRHISRLPRLLFLIVLSWAQSFGQVAPTPDVGLSSIREESMQATLRFLASGELEGRETTYRGQKVAALYIASFFQQLSLKPVGDGGSYYQRYNVVVSRPGKDVSISMRQRSGESKTFDELFSQFLFYPRGVRSQVITAPLAFVGYGIVSPDTEYNYNDYADIDVNGKIVLMMGFEPQEKDSTSRFEGRKPTRFSTRQGSQLKARLAKERGAVAVLMMTEVADHPKLAVQGRFFREFLAKGLMTLPDSSGEESQPIPTFSVTREVANDLLAPCGKRIEEIHARIDETLEPVSFDVPGTEITLNVDVQTSILQAENVLGLLEGSDPTLKDQVVVFTAHYDHLGIGTDGLIYHGADDDGSGTTAVLEIAKAFCRNPHKPRRSILFLTLSGEEKGLLGSMYYTNNPIIPLANTVADLNADMIGRVDPTYENSPDSARYVYVIGADKLSSDLLSTIEEANRETVNFKLDFRYDDPKDPNQFYRRSDHYNFARKGIPIAFFFSGTHVDYHRPTDTVDKINFQKMAETVRLIYLTGWKLANADRRPIINGNAEMYR
jgi:hypothetical protein